MAISKSIDILIVEDSITDAELILRTLKKCKCAKKIKVVKNGVEALDFLLGKGSYRGRKGRCKVMLLDLKLFKLNGMDVLHKLKANIETRTTPIVVFSSSKQEKDILESYNLGVNSYIAKPVDSKEFADTVFKICEYWIGLNKTIE
jgi:CheY-like chemotaxis protein